MATKILIVDDSTINNILLQNYLEAHGYDVVSALNGMEAIQILEHQPVDFMLLDMMMPGLNGLDVLAVMDEKQIHVPTIIVSAFINDEYRDEAYKLGARAYMSKPVNLKGLVSRIENVANTTQTQPIQ